MSERQVRRFGPTGRFFEAPRWRQGRWWVSDMTAQSVYSLSTDGEATLELSLDDRPSGLGWMPDGSMIVVSMDHRVVLRREPSATTARIHADLTALCAGTAGHLNDLVVSVEGHCYVGFDPDPGEYGFTSELGTILRVDPQGRSEIAARGLHFPNGMVISVDGQSLIAAETGTPRLTRFGIDVSGALLEPHVWAAVHPIADRRADATRPVAQKPTLLDGCALDSEGHIWVANAGSPSCLRVAPGGDIVDAVFIPDNYRCLACALGGENGRTLLLCGVDLGTSEQLATATSHLFVTQVDVPAA